MTTTATHPEKMPEGLTAEQRAGLIECFGSEEAAAPAAHALLKGTAVSAQPLPTATTVAPAEPVRKLHDDGRPMTYWPDGTPKTEDEHLTPSMPRGFRRSVSEAAAVVVHKITTSGYQMDAWAEQNRGMKHNAPVTVAEVERLTRAGDEAGLLRMYILGGADRQRAVEDVTLIMTRRAQLLVKNPDAFKPKPTGLSADAPIHARVAEAQSALSKCQAAQAAAEAAVATLRERFAKAHFDKINSAGTATAGAAAGRASQVSADLTKAEAELVAISKAQSLAHAAVVQVENDLVSEARTAKLQQAVAAVAKLEASAQDIDLCLSALAQGVQAYIAATIQLDGARDVVPNVPVRSVMLSHERVQGAVGHFDNPERKQGGEAGLRQFLGMERVEPAHRRPLSETAHKLADFVRAAAAKE